MGGATASPRGSFEPPNLAQKNTLYIYIYIYWPLNKNFDHFEPKFCLNSLKISLNIIILVLLSQ